VRRGGSLEQDSEPLARRALADERLAGAELDRLDERGIRT
jgi:hypothetical protein